MTKSVFKMIKLGPIKGKAIYRTRLGWRLVRDILLTKGKGNRFGFWKKRVIHYRCVIAEWIFEMKFR